ncbi:MAG TPA: hypothetical protein VGM41_00590 [Chitinophagaceae bacterium]|jgi:hypothetical protein
MNRYKIVIPVLILLLAGCQKFMGLSKQQDAGFEPHVLDPHINQNAWQYLKYRSGLDTTNPNYKKDTIFKPMYDAIIYSGIDTNEYTKPDRTFIFLHNAAVLTLTTTAPKVPASTCYWGYYQVSSPLRGATSWNDYSPAQVKSWLQYLIIQGQYSFDNLSPIEVTVNTLLPPGTDTLNPQSIMVLEKINDSNAKIRINGFVGSYSYTDVRTAGILGTNGPIHVVDTYVIYRAQ